ncbi:MAG: 1-acyl-sn-glycerol-3-phosphate acyltransferase [Spirochaetales bacterium]|nr:1-acyl-sn-glycerol-3-phosphate acyltransferase [Spirochaetales bacterium]
MKVSDLSQQLAALAHNLKGDYSFSPENVYQEGVPENREIIGSVVDNCLLKGSRIANPEAFVELHRRSQAGESCLVLAEHYSNLDFPGFYRLVEKEPSLGKDVASSLLPIRGMKLSETTPVTAAFTRSYDNIVIYPSRSLDSISDPNELAEVRKISVPINHSAMREMITRKHQGRIITVFPAGTRYRPWAPGSRKGVREIHSYVKTFDNVMFVAVNGNILPPHESDDMSKDEIVKDLLMFTCSDIVSGRKFRKQAEASAPEGVDPKQHVVDEVMNALAKLHDEMEVLRQKELG